MRHTIILIFVIVGLSMCSSPKNDNEILAKEFYTLNKNESFTGLSNLYIESRNTVYDSKTNMYDVKIYTFSIYDSASKSYIKVPVFPVSAKKEEILNVYNDCDENCKGLLRKEYGAMDDAKLTDAYESLVKKVLENYNVIKLPKQYPYSNVLKVVGNPSLNKITFKLTKEVEVLFLTKQDSIDAKQWNKLGEHWYYKVD